MIDKDPPSAPSLAEAMGAVRAATNVEGECNEDCPADCWAGNLRAALPVLARAVERLERAEALAAERLRECEQYAEQFKDIMGYDHMDRANRAEEEAKQLRADLAAAREERDDLRDGLQRSCDAIDAFGFRSDDYGGPHLSECIKKLGTERDAAREELDYYKRTDEALARVEFQAEKREAAAAMEEAQPDAD